MKPAEHPSMRTAASSRPAPSCVHSFSGGTASPSSRSHFGSCSNTCSGVHFPSTANAPDAAHRPRVNAAMAEILMAGGGISGGDRRRRKPSKDIKDCKDWKDETDDLRQQSTLLVRDRPCSP